MAAELHWVVVVALLFTPLRAVAWEQATTNDGIPMRWSTSCVSWTLAAQDIDNSSFEDPLQETIAQEELRRAVRASFDTWEQVDCSPFSFVETDPTHCLDVGLHQSAGNANRIFLRTSDWIEPDAPWREEDQIALTSVFYDLDTGEILDVDIEVNAEHFEITTLDEAPRTDLQNALTHELGHFIGLSHSEVFQSTMYPNAADTETSKRSLEQDDINGLCALYPYDDTPSTCLEPIGGLDLECETAEWCADPADGLTWECTFDELVCCCDEPGGFGACRWQTATECRSADFHSTLVLNRSLQCTGDPPGRFNTCCCHLGDDGASCRWETYEACSNSNGRPAVVPVTYEDLCGPPPSSDDCGCSTPGGGASGLLNRLLALIPF